MQIVYLMFVLCVAGVSVSGQDCTGLGIGGCEVLQEGFSCERANTCQDEQLVVLSCTREDWLTVDTVNCRCDTIGEAEGPCGILRDCSDVPDGNYPVCETDCRFYFTCFHGEHHGNTFCGGDLVYDYTQGLCNWPEAVCSPCGEVEGPQCDGMEQLCDVGVIPE